jgi:hypothetical protein
MNRDVFEGGAAVQRTAACDSVVRECAIDHSIGKWDAISSKVDSDPAVQALRRDSSTEGYFAKNRYLLGARIWTGWSHAMGRDHPADRDNFGDNPGDNRLPVTAVVVYA